MYCRMCGSKIGDTDRYCQLCGTSTGFKEPPAAPAEKSEIKEEVVFNPPYENKPRFAEEPERPEETAGPEKEKDLKEFISDREIDAAQKAQDDAGAEQEPAKTSEFTWNVYEFPTAKKITEEIEFNWSTEEHGSRPDPEPEQKDAEAAVFEEELFQEIRDDSSRIREQNIDRFFTFSRKNEEFQELLDREYDKIKSRSEPLLAPPQETHTEAVTEPAPPVEPEIEIPKDSEGEPQVEIPQESEAVQAEVTEPAEEEVPIGEEILIEEEPPAEEIPGVIDIPESEIIPAEQVEEPAEPIEEPAEPVEAPVEELEEPAEPVELTEPAELQEAPKAEHLSEMAQARAQYFGDELIKDNESIRKSMEEHIQEEKEAEHYTEPPETPEATEQEQEEDIDRRAESVAAAYAAAAAERPPEQEPDVSTAAAYAAAPDEEEAVPHKRSAGQIVLSIIAVILVIEIVILGIRYFAPDSAAAKAIGSAQTGIFKTITGFTDSITGLFSGDDSKDQTAPPEDNDKNTASSGAIEDDQSAGQTQTENGTAAQTPAPDPNPMSDKNALVTSQLGNNSNILQVKANTALAYVPGKNYGLSDINNSKPITNNVWLAPEGGDPVYYDKSVVGTVIAFDSQWIDYVSGSSKSVLDLLKKDSEAYRRTLGYTKVGKVKETFKLLEIGEIRQGAKGFYVWVHEEISITEKGTTADKAYNWIYYLEPSDGKMQIVNYFKF